MSKHETECGLRQADAKLAGDEPDLRRLTLEFCGPLAISIGTAGERMALGYQFHISSSREQAIKEAAPAPEPGGPSTRS